MVGVERVGRSVFWNHHCAISVDDPLGLHRTNWNLLCFVGVELPQFVLDDAKSVGGHQLAIPNRLSEDVRDLRQSAIPI